MYTQLKEEGKTSVNPLKESFGKRANFKMVLLALFGAVMGQGVIWYTSQFYAQSFLENTVKIDFIQNREIMLWAIGLATPFFLVFGAWSDKIAFATWGGLRPMAVCGFTRPMRQRYFHSCKNMARDARASR